MIKPDLFLGKQQEMTFTTEELTTLRATHFSTNGVALICSVIVICSYWREKRKAVFPLRLAYYVSLADFFTEFFSLFPLFFLSSPLTQDVEEMNRVACWFQGTYAFNIAAALWTTSIAFTVYRMIIHLDHQCDRFEKYFHVFNWGLPAILVMIITFTNQFGPTNPFCYVFKNSTPMRFLMLYTFIIAALLYDLVMYYVVFKGVKVHKQEISSMVNIKDRQYLIFESKLSRRMMSVVLVFLFSWAWPIVNRTYALLEPEQNFWFFWLHHFFLPLEGLWNSLVYWDNKRVRQKVGWTSVKLEEKERNEMIRKTEGIMLLDEEQ